MKQYLDLLQHVLDNGTQKGDRTGTGTISTFGHQLRFDLSNSFPLVTTKKMFLKGIIHELLWIISGSTNIKYLKDNGVNIWNEWIKKESNIGGPSDLRPLVWIDAKISNGKSNYSGNYSTKGLKTPRGSTDDKLKNVWVKMMKRCYDPNHHNYSSYGGSGVTVSHRWHDPKLFIEDVKFLNNWESKLDSWNEYELDKDYYGSSVYGANTCVWLHTSENNYYTKASNPIIVTESDGKKTKYITQAHASRNLDISTSSLSRFVDSGVLKEGVKGNNKKFLDWKFESLKNNGKLLRMDFSKGELGPVYGEMWRSWPSEGGKVDQLKDVISSIKNNPNSRRHIVTAWNPELITQQALPPCHCFFQFYVNNGKLSCQLYQRSADVFLGVPFNIASYALLTMMIAQVCDLEPGEFIHTFGDVHIYNNHIDQVRLQLTREPIEGPKMIINPEIKDINDFKYEDFELQGYNHHPAIKAKVSV